MRKDTRTFLATVLGIPLILGSAWGFNAANEASVVVYEREHVAAIEPEVPEPAETPEAVTEPATPAAPVRTPTPARTVAQPVVVPVPVVTPVVTPVIEPQPTEPAPTPVAKKKSRRTRAS